MVAGRIPLLVRVGQDRETDYNRLLILEERTEGALLGVSSGFADWDRLSEGLVPGNLIILAGRPGMGKTSLALDVVRHVALNQARPVAFFSLEMSRIELTQRIL